jgi:hypothetical protein
VDQRPSLPRKQPPEEEAVLELVVDVLAHLREGLGGHFEASGTDALRVFVRVPVLEGAKGNRAPAPRAEQRERNQQDGGDREKLSSGHLRAVCRQHDEPGGDGGQWKSRCSQKPRHPPPRAQPYDVGIPESIRRPRKPVRLCRQVRAFNGIKSAVASSPKGRGCAIWAPRARSGRPPRPVHRRRERSIAQSRS